VDHKHEVIVDDPTPSRLFGVSQGNQDAGTCHLHRFHDPNSRSTTLQSFQHCHRKRKAEAFVDTDLWVNATKINPVNTDALLPPASILNSLTTLAQWWYHLLRTSGGALGFHKCLWTGMIWTWTNRKTGYITEDEFPDELILETDTPDLATVVITTSPKVTPRRSSRDLDYTKYSTASTQSPNSLLRTRHRPRPTCSTTYQNGNRHTCVN
jgi:hypothetical protein